MPTQTKAAGRTPSRWPLRTANTSLVAMVCLAMPIKQPRRGTTQEVTTLITAATPACTSKLD